MMTLLTTGFSNEGCEKIFLAILLASNSCFQCFSNLLHITGVLNLVAHQFRKDFQRFLQSQFISFNNFCWSEALNLQNKLINQ
jgi:hypothetical protein